MSGTKLESQVDTATASFKANSRLMIDRQTEIKNEEERIRQGGGAKAIESQHKKGRLTARERIYALLDEGSFVELDALARHRSTNFGLAEKRPLGDGVVTGYGTIDGRDVCIFSQDVTVFGGSLNSLTETAYAAAGEPGRYFSERSTRRR